MEMENIYKQEKDETSSSSSSELSSSDEDDLQQASGTFTIADEQAKDILSLLRQTIHLDELLLTEDNKVDNADAQQQSNISKVIEENRKIGIEDDDDEIASNPADKLDDIRIANLEGTRPKWLNFSLKFFFHLMVFANFFTSWYDSAGLLLENAKMNLWLLEDDYNCLDIVSSANVDIIDHIINILHALLSCCVLYVQKRNSATLCLAWVSSQAVHTVFKTFQYFYNLKFDKTAFGTMKGVDTLIYTIFFNAFGSLLLLHKYYDLTDCYKTRSKYFGTTDIDERSLNDRIIYKNETGFLQRKNTLREVTNAQTYAIIQKIGKHAKQGLNVDPLSLDREVHAAKLALADCATAENHHMMFILKKSYAHRLKELEDQQEKVFLGMVGQTSSTANQIQPEKNYQ